MEKNTWLENTIEEIQRHIATLNDDYTSLTTKLARLEIQVDIIMKINYAIFIAVVGLIGKAFYDILIK